jgi:oligopeptide/dipeptide ABC transporter ATP-binding protein
VLIAMALGCNPRLLIADEPTTALDVTIQAQIVRLVNGIRRARGMAVIWITHDLALLRGLVDRVAVMYGGRVVEEAPIEAVFHRPAHPYTQRLLAAAPRLDRPRGTRLTTIDGLPPVLRAPPVGCSFAPRCARATERCRIDTPIPAAIAPRHRVACWHPVTEEAAA